MRHCRSHTPIVRNIRMMTRIPALVVGTGFGCRTHVPALRAAGFDVVGLVGADAARTARRAEKSGIVASYTDLDDAIRSEEHTSELQSLMRISYAVLGLKKKKKQKQHQNRRTIVIKIQKK